MLEIEAADGGALRCQFAETTVEVVRDGGAVEKVTPSVLSSTT